MASALCSVSIMALPPARSAPVPTSLAVRSRAAESERKQRPSCRRRLPEKGEISVVGGGEKQTWHSSARRRSVCDSRGRIEASVTAARLKLAAAEAGNRQSRQRWRLRRGGISGREGESTTVAVNRQPRRRIDS
jgi:hypothetical protein